MKRQYTLDFSKHCGFSNIVAKESCHNPFVIKDKYNKGEHNFDGFIVEVEEKLFIHSKVIKLNDKCWLFAIATKTGYTCHFIKNPVKDTNIPSHVSFEIAGVYTNTPYTLNVVLFTYLMLQGHTVVNKGVHYVILNGLKQHTHLPKRGYTFINFFILPLIEEKKIKIVTAFGKYVGDVCGITPNVYKRLTVN